MAITIRRAESRDLDKTLKLLGEVLSLFGFILSIAVGAIVFGISTAFALVLLCIAAGWLLIKLIF